MVQINKAHGRRSKQINKAHGRRSKQINKAHGRGIAQVRGGGGQPHRPAGGQVRGDEVRSDQEWLHRRRGLHPRGRGEKRRPHPTLFFTLNKLINCTVETVKTLPTHLVTRERDPPVIR
eukprot:1181015-Prorocentrum_minimum.AAC.1